MGLLMLAFFAAAQSAQAFPVPETMSLTVTTGVVPGGIIDVSFTGAAPGTGVVAVIGETCVPLAFAGCLPITGGAPAQLVFADLVGTGEFEFPVPAQFGAGSTVAVVT